MPLGLGTGTVTVLRSWASSIDLDLYEPSVIIGIDGDAQPVLPLELGAIPVYRIPTLSSAHGWFPPSLVSLARLFSEIGLDIAHAMTIQADILATIAGRLAGTSTVVSWVPGYPYRSRTPALKKLVYRLLYRMVHPHQEGILVVSNQLRSDLIRDFGVAPDKVDVMHVGLDKGFLEDSKHISAPSFNNLVVGTMATLIPEKGIGDFIDAAVIVLKEFPATRFLIAGDGPDKERFRHKVNALGLEDVIKFRGWVYPCIDVLKDMDVFVLPSYQEGLPLVVLESMACGRPTIATNVGGIPEIITDKRIGLLVEAGQPESIARAVISLARDPASSLLMGQRAKKDVISRFTSRRQIDALHKFYAAKASYS